MNSKIIAQGAEAIIYLEKSPITKTSPRVGGRGSGTLEGGAKFIVIKDRIKKSYRIPELDKKIRKHRTKSETKLLEKASKVINCPIPKVSKEFNKIEIPYIKGKKLSASLDKFSVSKQKKICKLIGEEIAKLHDADIIHGDLTTSNIILIEEKESKNNQFQKQVRKLKKLKLPRKEYAIFGSGPLAIRGIRESNDIDLIVSSKLWNRLIKKYPQENEELIKIDSIEIYKKWNPEFSINELIKDADIFDGIRFVKIKYVLAWKKAYNRDKDKKDIKLIENWVAKRGSETLEGGAKISSGNNKPEIFLIDFGLGYISTKTEDKAVDLHLLKQAIEAKHFKHWKELMKEVLTGYKKSKHSEKTLERLKAVEKRGRHKH